MKGREEGGLVPGRDSDCKGDWRMKKERQERAGGGEGSEAEKN